MLEIERPAYVTFVFTRDAANDGLLGTACAELPAAFFAILGVIEEGGD